MAKINDLIAEVAALPAEERARVIDSLLRSLNPPDPEIDQAWFETARRRLADLRSRRVEPIPGPEVFQKIKDRFGR